MACGGGPGRGGITYMDWLVRPGQVRPHFMVSMKRWRVGHSYTRSRLYVDYYGLQLKFTHQVVLAVVGCSVATGNDACVRRICGYIRPCHVGLN
jgi:hypothetical protein